MPSSFYLGSTGVGFSRRYTRQMGVNLQQIQGDHMTFLYPPNSKKFARYHTACTG